MPAGTGKSPGPISRFLSGKQIIPIALGGVISMLMVASALYISVSAGRSALPTPLPVHAPNVPEVALIVPSPSLFIPRPAPEQQPPTAGGGSDSLEPAGSPAAGYQQLSREVAPAASSAGVLPAGGAGEAIHPRGAPMSAGGGDHESRDHDSRDSVSRDRHD